jgi:biotin transport system permease protein
MRALYAEGETWLHRLSPRKKLIALALFSTALFLTRSPLLLGSALIAACVILLQIGLGARELWLRLRPVLLTIAMIAAFSFVLVSASDAAVVLLRLTALTLFAAAVTATVSIAQFIDEITLAARPLEKMGWLQAADIGLAVGLVIRFVPEIVNRYGAIRDAHHARGIACRLHTVIVPLIILTLKDADAIADAIDARGFRGQSSKSDLSKERPCRDNP